LGSEVAALLRRIVHPRSHQGFSNLEGRRGRALYRRESRSYPYDASMRNLAKARASCRYRRPLPWRSKAESEMIRRFTFWWLTCRDRSRPSGRAWDRQLGVSHTWLQKLVREFSADPSEMWGLQRSEGDPTLAQLSRAMQYSQEMRERGELRRPRRSAAVGRETRKQDSTR
jgi:hypothetical protein